MNEDKQLLGPLSQRILSGAPLAPVTGYDALRADLKIVKQALEAIRSDLSDNPLDVDFQANEDVWWAILSVDNALRNLPRHNDRDQARRAKE